MVLKKPVAYISLEECNALKRTCDIVYERSSHTENGAWMITGINYCFQ